MSELNTSSNDNPVTTNIQEDHTSMPSSSLSTTRTSLVQTVLRRASWIPSSLTGMECLQESSPSSHINSEILKSLEKDPYVFLTDLPRLSLLTEMQRICIVVKVLETVILCARSASGVLPDTFIIGNIDNILRPENLSCDGPNTNQDQFTFKDRIIVMARKLKLQPGHATGEALVHAALSSLPDLVHLSLHTLLRPQPLRSPNNLTLKTIFEDCSFPKLETWITNIAVTEPMLKFTLKLRSMRKLCFYGDCSYADTAKKRLHQQFTFELGSEDSILPELCSFGYSRETYAGLVQAITSGRSIEELLVYAPHTDSLSEQLSDKYIRLDTRMGVKRIELYRVQFIQKDLETIAKLFPNLLALKVYVCDENYPGEQWSKADLSCLVDPRPEDSQHILDLSDAQKGFLRRFTFDVEYNPTLIPNHRLRSENKNTTGYCEVIEVFRSNDGEI